MAGPHSTCLGMSRGSGNEGVEVQRAHVKEARSDPSCREVWHHNPHGVETGWEGAVGDEFVKLFLSIPQPPVNTLPSQ